MEEQFFTITKHATTFRIKSGVTKDGRITARECEVWWNGGAYADIGPRVTQKSGFTAPGPYDIEHVAIDSYALYTNLPPAGALRGFGIPQLVWAYESHTDMIARALKLDPLEFRRKNLLRDGRPQATGTLMQDAALEQGARPGRGADGLGAAVRPRHRYGPARARPRDRLQGVRRTDHFGGDRQRSMPTAAAASIAAPSTWARAPTPRWRRSRARCCASQRNRSPWSTPTPTSTPYDMATLGSRSLFHMGNAVRLAAEDARDKLRALAQEAGLPAGDRRASRRHLPQELRHAGGERRSARRASSRATRRPTTRPGSPPT